MHRMEVVNEEIIATCINMDESCKKKKKLSQRRQTQTNTNYDCVSINFKNSKANLSCSESG